MCGPTLSNFSEKLKKYITTFSFDNLRVLLILIMIIKKEPDKTRGESVGLKINVFLH